MLYLHIPALGGRYCYSSIGESEEQNVTEQDLLCDNVRKNLFFCHSGALRVSQTDDTWKVLPDTPVTCR